MSLFAVIMSTPKPVLTAALKLALPDHFVVHDRLLVIRTDLAAKAIFDSVTLPDDERKGFIIVQITADYYGFAAKGFWDWLGTSFKGDRNG